MALSETYGWDTVFVVDLALFNALLDKVVFEPASIGVSSTGDTTPDTTVSWTVGSAVVDDVYGSQLKVVYTLAEGKIISADAPVDLTNWKVALTANFALVRGAGTASAATGPGATPDKTVDIWANVDVFPEGTVDFDTTYLVITAWQQFLATPAALDQFEKLFGGLNLSSAAEKQKDMLAPKVTRVAGAVDSSNRKTIACLARTIDDDISGRLIQLSASALPSTDSAAFVISGDCFLTSFILPALSSTFGTDASTIANDFPISDGISVGNTAPLSLQIKDEHGGLHHATIAPGNFTLDCSDRIILTIRDMTVLIDLGQMNLYTIRLQYSETLSVALTTDPKDPTREVLLFHTEGNPEVSHDIDPSVWVEIGTAATQIILSVIEALAGRAVVSGAGSYGFSAITARIMGGLVSLLIGSLGLTVAHADEIATDIEKGDFSKVPSFAIVLDVALSSVSWGRSARFSPNNVTLAGGLVCSLDVATA